MGKKAFGAICVTLVFVGIILIIVSENTGQLRERIVPTLIFAVLAFFLLKPSKKKNVTNSTAPSNKQSGTVNSTAHSNKQSSTVNYTASFNKQSSTVKSNPHFGEQLNTNAAPQLAAAIEEFGKLFQSLNSTKQTQSQTTAPIDEFEKLYHLLHSGIITQEEFDAKKKQLLGL